jgi:FkbM family methyltransferase
MMNRIRFYVHFTANALRYSYLHVLAKIFAIIERRKSIPSSIKNAIMKIKDKHFNPIQEENIVPFFEMNPEKAFLDVGANEGKYTLLMALKSRHVYAWEPNPLTAKKLRDNVKGRVNVTVFSEALGEAEGILDLYLHDRSIYDSLIVKREGYTKTVKTKVRSLDSYVFPEGVGIIKIDTEGAEIPILRGGAKTILKERPMLIIEVHDPYEENIRELLKLLPFYTWYRSYKLPRLLGQRASHLIGVSKTRRAQVRELIQFLDFPKAEVVRKASVQH